MTDEHIVPSFWLSEFLDSDTADRLGISNVPKAVEMANVRNILAPGMQRVREILGRPVSISSGYRSLDLNRAVKGSRDSQHCDGLAADFKCPGYGTPLEICRKLVAERGNIGYDQLIHEGRWVHISWPGAGKFARDMVLTAHFSAKGVTYTAGLA